MAIRQYIGARYVPRFTGLYDATQIYDAMDVVDNGSGTSYIAKKTVPAGTPLNNTDYWFVYGASSGAILNLQNRMSAAEHTIDRLANKKFILCGDSYAGGISPDPGAVGWFSGFITLNGLTLDSNCFTPHDVPILAGNSKFSRVNTTRSFYDQLKAVYDNYTTDIEDEITDIIVLGGSNDFAENESDIFNGMSDFMTFAKANYPNAVVKVGVLAGFTANDHTKLARFEKVLIQYRRISELGGIYISNSEYICAKKSLISSDGTHPTAAGYTEINKYVASLAVADHLDIERIEAITSALFDLTGADITGGIPQAANIRYKNDLMLFDSSGTQYINVSLASPMTMGGVGLALDLKLGILSSNLLNVNGVNSVDKFPVSVVLTDLAGHAYPGTGNIVFLDGGEVRLLGYVFNATGSLTGSANLDHIFINGLDLKLPTWKYCY